MSSQKILVFLLSVFALLAGIGFVFPEDGIKLGEASLEFPSPKEVGASLLHRNGESKGPTPEELLAQRMEELKQAEQELDIDELSTAEFI